MSGGYPKRERSVVSIPAEPLFAHASNRCLACWACVRECPAKAIRVAAGRSEIIAERCVKCGTCVTTCANGAHRVRDDLGQVRALLDGHRPVVLVLASEYVAALHPIRPHEAETILLSRGFAAVETTVLGEDLVASAYEQVHARIGSIPSLRSTCPVATEWVRKYHPQLTEALVPIVPPYIAQARLIRTYNQDKDVAIVYVSPCWARKDEVYEYAFLGDIDVAIGFDELLVLLKEDGLAVAAEPPPLRRPKATKQVSGIDGFPLRTLRDHCRTSEEVMVARGLDDIEQLLTAITRGEAAPGVVDMLACEGCIDGPCVNTGLSVFRKRHIDRTERENELPPLIDSREFLANIPAIDLLHTFKPIPAPARTPSQEDIDRVLFAGEFFSRGDTIDCGTCGYETCIDHAAAICLGDSTWDMCFPLTRKQLQRERERCEQETSSDELTGLLNRRAVHERLAHEVSRAQRYGGTISMILMDLDDFRRFNDMRGFATGDKMLRAIGRVLDAALRESDAAGRFGGDEFVLVLPNTTKVEAWAVAEKLRVAVNSLSIDGGDGERALSTTASYGVASLGEAAPGARELIGAAMQALEQAKLSGHDRVELAAG